MLEDFWRDPATHGKWLEPLSEYGDLLDDDFWDDDLPFNEYSVTNGGQDYLPKPESIIREVRVGRNGRCPCGSGKKYKNCCLRIVQK